MSLEGDLDDLAREIRRVNGEVTPIALEELATQAPAVRSNGRVPTADSGEIEWLVELGGDDTMNRSRMRWATLAAGVAAALALFVVVGGRISSNQDDDPPVSSLDATDEPVEQAPVSRSPVEIVEARYEAMNALDFEAAHAEVADDAVYCFLFLPRLEIEGCQDGTTGYHDVGGLGDQDEIDALRAHAYGGAIAYSCSGDSTTVTCTEQVTHRLADLAGVELQLLTVTFDVAGGEVMSVDRVPDAPEGVAISAVGSQEAIYVAWLGEQYPEEFDDLVFSGRPRISAATVPRHRQLIVEWIETLG